MVPNALVLVTDRLGSGYLGPYGNTWLETPAWNRLAARATLFETALIDSPNLLRLYDSYWHGRHALSASHAQQTPALAELLADKRVQTWLITDERLVAEQPSAQRFDERVILSPGENEPADEMEQTQLARVYATVLEVLQQAEPPFLIWVHAQGMQASWDAPYEFRTQFAEEEDPDPPDFTEPPEHHLAGGYDPDLLLGIQHAYGGQVSLLDSCLDILLDALWSSSLGDSTAVLATATRGFPMGEHRYVGRTELPLFGELIQVPWLNCWPNAAGAAWRLSQMVQPPDMYTTLLNWFGVPPVSDVVWGRSLQHDAVAAPSFPDQLIACCAHEQQRSVRVPSWFLRCDGAEVAELYVKPDDRWEFNEISSRCVEVVDEMTQLTSQFEAAARENDRRQLPKLSDALRRS